MLWIDSDNNITLTRGDTAVLTLSVKNAGVIYDFSADYVQLTVKRNTVNQEIVFQKTFNSDSITIDPADTENLTYTNFVYDVQIIDTDNNVFTVIPPRRFTIAEEVNFNDERP